MSQHLTSPPTEGLSAHTCTEEILAARGHTQVASVPQAQGDRLCEEWGSPIPRPLLHLWFPGPEIHLGRVGPASPFVGRFRLGELWREERGFVIATQLPFNGLFHIRRRRPTKRKRPFYKWPSLFSKFSSPSRIREMKGVAMSPLRV